MRQSVRAITLFALLIATLQPISTFAEERPSTDINKTTVYGLDKCSSTTQLDCIESTTIITSGDKRLAANQIVAATGSELDFKNQVVESGVSIWQYTTAAGAVNSFALSAELTTPTYVVDGSLEKVELVDDDENATEETDTGEAKTGKETEVDTRFFEPKLAISALFAGERTPTGKALLTGESLEIVVRTSWLAPEEVFLPGRKASISRQSIAGGNKITMAGSEVLIYDRVRVVSQSTGRTSFQVIAKSDFDFTILHSKSGSKSCASEGYKFTTSNAPGLSLSEENEANSLKFVASGYPYLPDGSLINGYALIRIPISWITCKFPNSELGLADKFDVTVTTTDASKIVQNPRTNATLSNGILEVLIENFHFAQTEILISADATAIAQKKEVELKAASDAQAKAEADAKAKADEEARAKLEAEAKAKAEADAKAKADEEAAKAMAPKKTSKKTTITCLKGKTVKKVTAVKPKCPAGFKKK